MNLLDALSKEFNAALEHEGARPLAFVAVDSITHAMQLIAPEQRSLDSCRVSVTVRRISNFP